MSVLKKKIAITLLLTLLLNASLAVVPVYADCESDGEDACYNNTNLTNEELQDCLAEVAETCYEDDEAEGGDSGNSGSSDSDSSSATTSAEAARVPDAGETLKSSSSSSSETIQSCGMSAEALTEEAYSYTSFIWSQAQEVEAIKNNNDYDKESFTLNARIVELTEALPGATDSVGESFLVTAYKGVCCTKATGEKCSEYGYVYTDNVTDCEQYSESDDCHPVQLLVSTSGINLLKFYILQVYIWAASVVGIIAVLVIVISGVQIAASGGEEQLTSARTRIMQSLAGLALLFLSGLILYTINPTFFTK